MLNAKTVTTGFLSVFLLIGCGKEKIFISNPNVTTIRIRDKDFLRYTYFDLGQKNIAKPDTGGGLPAFTDEFQPGDSLVGDPLFFRAYPYAPPPPNSFLTTGACFVNPSDTTLARNEAEYGFFQWLPPETYQLNRDSFYVRFNFPLSSVDFIGVMMQIYRQSGDSIENIGYVIRDTSQSNSDSLQLVLKLIKHRNPNASHYTFYYEWKNVYDLKMKNIDPAGFVVKIYEGRPGQETDPNRRDYQKDFTGFTIRYLRLLGLDRYTLAGSPGFDDRIDLNNTVMDLESGYLFFPDRYPFNNTRSFTGAPEDTLIQKVPQIYGDNPIQAGQYSLYFIETTKTGN